MGISVNYGHHYLLPFGSLILYHGISILSVLHPTEALRVVNFSRNKQYSSLCIISNYLCFLHMHALFYKSQLFISSQTICVALNQLSMWVQFLRMMKQLWADQNSCWKRMWNNETIKWFSKARVKLLQLCFQATIIKW